MAKKMGKTKPEFNWTDKGPLAAANHSAVFGVCLFIEGRAKHMAPYDTGNLTRSIGTKMMTSPSDTPTLGVVTADAEYAVYQEYGTKFHKAHPFMGPALEQARKKYGG